MSHDGDMTNTTHTRNTADRRLQRIHEDRILAGVSAGLGDYLDINAWWIRLAFIILTVFGGAGVLIYAIAWIVIPDERDEDPIITGWLRRLDTSDGGAIFGFVLIGAAALIVLSQVADVSGAIVVALILFVAGLLLYRGDLLVPKKTPPDATPSNDERSDDPMSDDTTNEPDSLGTDGGEGTDAVPSTTATALIEPAPPAPPTPPPAAPARRREPRPPREPRERSMLGRITLAVGLIVLAGMALLDLAFDSITIEPIHYLGAAVASVGLGLIVGGFVGKARWLILVGLLLMPALWFTSFWPSGLDWNFGDRRYEPVTVDSVQSDYSLGMGSMRLDLTGLTPVELAEVGKIDASVGMGELVVYLPADVYVRLVAEVGAGEISGPFQTTNGVGLDRIVEFGSGSDVLELNLDVGAGVIQIRGPIRDGYPFGLGERSVVVEVNTDWSN